MKMTIIKKKASKNITSWNPTNRDKMRKCNQKQHNRTRANMRGQTWCPTIFRWTNPHSQATNMYQSTQKKGSFSSRSQFNHQYIRWRKKAVTSSWGARDTSTWLMVMTRSPIWIPALSAAPPKNPRLNTNSGGEGHQKLSEEKRTRSENNNQGRSRTVAQLGLRSAMKQHYKPHKWVHRCQPCFDSATFKKQSTVISTALFFLLHHLLIPGATDRI